LLNSQYRTELILSQVKYTTAQGLDHTFLLLGNVLRDLGDEDKGWQYKRDGEFLAKNLSMTEEEWEKIKRDKSADSAD